MLHHQYFQKPERPLLALPSVVRQRRDVLAEIDRVFWPRRLGRPDGRASGHLEYMRTCQKPSAFCRWQNDVTYNSRPLRTTGTLW